MCSGELISDIIFVHINYVFVCLLASYACNVNSLSKPVLNSFVMRVRTVLPVQARTTAYLPFQPTLGGLGGWGEYLATMT